MRFGKRVALAGGLIVLILAGCGKGNDAGKSAAAGGSQAGEGVTIATVNGTVITSSDLQNEVSRLMRRFGGSLPPGDPAEQKSKVEDQAVDNLVAKLVLYDAVREAQIAITPADLDERFASYKQQFPSEDAYRQQLQVMGMTEEKLRSEIGMAMQIETLLQNNVGETRKATDEECRAFYEENKSQFDMPEKIRASHILITVAPDASQEEKDAARAKAEELRKRCLAGEDFAELARANSQGPSAPRGGDLGWFPRDRMVKPFADAAFSLKEGEISDVVETQFGYHVIKLVEHADPRMVSFDEVRDKIAENLEAEYRQEAVDAYIDSLREKSDVQIARR